MISVVLYGRNDSYGYNLHKRAALSLNCIAEMLTGDRDEILFVDYNTPEGFPTFPEAIQDTLTKSARQRLRIFRVRPHIHRRLKGRTRLLAIEPLSRNVAIRRSNPQNRWILSTNTDLIFVTSSGQSITDSARRLPRGFYATPRIEIPETLWEGLDRLNPKLAIKTVREWGGTLHLNEIVRGAKTILYDGPGDFQLMERRDLFDIHGFDEEMILGWHVDSNIFKRLYLIYGKVGDFSGKVLGYHCDHTRQLTPAHSDSRTQNDSRRFVDDVLRPDLPEQAKSWGCADDEIEELRLKEDPSAVYVQALREAIGPPLKTLPVVDYTRESYNRSDYDPRHVLPFLADMFVCSERHINVAWSGGRRETLRLFAEIWKKLGFTGQILVDDQAARAGLFATVPEAKLVDLLTLVAEADAFLIDFGTAEDTPSAKLGGKLSTSLNNALSLSWLAMVQAERVRMSRDEPPRRVFAINAIHNIYESIVCSDIVTAATPFGCRIRHGFVRPPLPDRAVAALQDRLAQAEARESELKNSIAGFQTSNSWRVTAPLRALSRLLGRRP